MERHQPEGRPVEEAEKRREKEKEATHEVVGKPQLVGRSIWQSFGMGWHGLYMREREKTVACGTTKHL